MYKVILNYYFIMDLLKILLSMAIFERTESEIFFGFSLATREASRATKAR